MNLCPIFFGDVDFIESSVGLQIDFSHLRSDKWMFPRVFLQFSVVKIELPLS